MTRKIFWGNPYLTDLDTLITGVNGNDVAVEQTIFFAMSGGQESDRGTIDGKAVHKARKTAKNFQSLFSTPKRYA